jgi:hypothetical protein
MSKNLVIYEEVSLRPTSKEIHKAITANVTVWRFLRMYYFINKNNCIRKNYTLINTLCKIYTKKSFDILHLFVLAP